MNKITSLTNPYIKKLFLLRDRKAILKHQLFLIEGENIIKEAYKCGLLTELLIINEKSGINYDVKKTFVTKEIINKLSMNKTNVGIIGICVFQPNTYDVNSFDKIVILENVNNPNNLGAIARSALAFGFDAIFLMGESVFQYNEKTIRSSQGAVFTMPIIEISNLKKLDKFTLFYFILNETAKNYQEIELNKKIGLVFGNEAKGLSSTLIKNNFNNSVYIPIKNIDSLNLAIAASIAMVKFN
ncbi:MAG: RNA methyltransferase [Mycoplasmataceae bacterium]|nr:RNA methyltransferase [Mycoplasmataceae bacterium]